MTDKKLYAIGASMFVAAIAVFALIVVVFTNTSGRNNENTVNNVEIRDGVQYVTVTAKGGYFPSRTVVSPNIPTKLIVKTNNTYDCSSSLVVREAGFREFLQPTGEVEIDLGSMESGQKIEGVCSMGMYSFEIQA